MDNKLLYWIPVIGVFLSLMNYDKENGMHVIWNYYQAIMIMALISLVTLKSF